MKVLFLDIDTLRADHLGCYGYHRDTSPAIDQIASDGMRFENYHCSDAPCLPSRTALMTGQFGIHTGVVGHGGTAADRRLQGASRGFKDDLQYTGLWGQFRMAGMRTASIGPFAERHSTWSFNAGFNEVIDIANRGGYESAEEVTPEVLRWLDANRETSDWLLHVNYWDPHTPYRVPESYGNPFEGEPMPEWITESVLSQHRNKVGPHSASEINMFNSETNPAYPRYPGKLETLADVRRMMDGYDCGISYTDSHIGRIIAELKARRIYDEMAIIVTGDHGENMGELGIYGEHATADYPNTRIPMIIKWPGCTPGRVDTGLHYSLDLLPTISELLGTKKRDVWDGTSYARTLTSDEASGHRYLVVGQCAHTCQRGVRFGSWMYIRTYHDGYHLFPQEMLFDIEKDPHEQANCAQDNPEVCREAVYLLNEWHDRMMSTMESDIDPLWTVIREGGPLHARGALPAYCRRLEETGRGWAVDELKRRHPGEFDERKRW